VCRFLVEHGGVNVNVVHEGTTALYHAGTHLPISTHVQFSWSLVLVVVVIVRARYS
jgi:hypothetical protein